MRISDYADHYPGRCKDFYTLFDPLPRPLKEMLWLQDRMPTKEDVLAAWDLTEEDGSYKEKTDEIKRGIFKEGKIKNRKRIEAKEAKRKKEEERRNKFYDRSHKRTPRFVTEYVVIDKRKDKHGRLVRLFSKDELEKKIASRIENKDITPVIYIVPKVVPEKKANKELKFLEKEPNSHQLKVWHNG